MIRLLLFCLSILCSPLLFAQDFLNMEVTGQYDHNDGRASGSWSYVAPDGKEYALLGAQTGTVIVSLEGNTPDEVAFIPGPSSNWREITVVEQHAYVTTEGGSPNHPGMQVISLENLPFDASLVSTFNSTFTRGHIIQKDIFEEAPYVYVCGTSSTSGVHIIDVSDPVNPQEVGLYNPGYYIHDCHVRGDIMYAAAFYEGYTDVLDISDRTNPVLITQIPDPGNNTHSYSTTTDGNFLIVADEQDGLPGRIYDISDIESPVEVAQYTASQASLVHNPYVRGDFCFISHNTEGIRVLDIVDPATPVEVGYYDTFDGASGGFSGLWSACPYFPSGKIIGGNRENGLYVWSFNNTYAGRYYGQVVDSIQGSPIFNASVEITETEASFTSDIEGKFQGGSLAGSYTIVVEAEGYMTKTVDITLEEGENLNLVIEMSQTISSIEQVHQEAMIKVAPNPVSSFTQVSWNQGVNASRLKVVSQTGQMFKQYEVAATNKMTLSVQDLPVAGTYYILLFDEHNVLLGKRSLIVN